VSKSLTQVQVHINIIFQDINISMQSEELSMDALPIAALPTVNADKDGMAEDLLSLALSASQSSILEDVKKDNKGEVTVVEYLNSSIVPVLRAGLRALALKRPQDPHQFLADFIISNKPANDPSKTM
jgi:hypothetical protein